MTAVDVVPSAVLVELRALRTELSARDTALEGRLDSMASKSTSEHAEMGARVDGLTEQVDALGAIAVTTPKVWRLALTAARCAGGMVGLVATVTGVLAAFGAI